jgi:hypothetical protein
MRKNREKIQEQSPVLSEQIKNRDQLGKISARTEASFAEQIKNRDQFCQNRSRTETSFVRADQEQSKNWKNRGTE